jgi:hypothetical protein
LAIRQQAVGPRYRLGTQPSLGTLIRSGYDLIFAGIWWVTALPGLTLVGVLVAVNVLGDTLRDALESDRRDGQHDEDGLGRALGDEATARNTWLRHKLYQHDYIEANFLASDEDYLALRPLGLSHYLNADIHTGYYFLEDMGTWLAGSPRMTCFDGGIRNTWRLLREEQSPARGFSSHMPQIINKSVCNKIFDRFVDIRGPAYDEWSLYFNVASQLYPSHFTQQPYSTLGWPMRTGDWFPELTPLEPAFENHEGLRVL